MNDEDQNRPAYMTFTVTVQHGIDTEAMLFSAMCEITRRFDFADLDNQAKARCARHLSEMLYDADIPR